MRVPQLRRLVAAGGGGEATFKNGKATVGVSGDLAALVGLEVDASVSVNTKQIQKDATSVQKVSEQVIADAPKVVTQTSNIIVDAAKKTGDAISSGAKKAGNAMKKAFRF